MAGIFPFAPNRVNGNFNGSLYSTFRSPNQCKTALRAQAKRKVIAEGFRRLPILFPHYALAPQIGNDQFGRMEPVSRPPRYGEPLARLDADEPGATPATFEFDHGEKSMSLNMAPYGGGLSKAAAEAMDYLSPDILSIEFQRRHRTAIIDFLNGELDGPNWIWRMPASPTQQSAISPPIFPCSPGGHSLCSILCCALSSVVEHYLHTVGVAGSKPAARTIFPLA